MFTILAAEQPHMTGTYLKTCFAHKQCADNSIVSLALDYGRFKLGKKVWRRSASSWHQYTSLLLLLRSSIVEPFGISSA